MEEKVVRLTDNDIAFLQEKYPSLIYDVEKNIITGNLWFNVQYKDEEAIEDNYLIEINLNKVILGVPAVREIGGKILNIAIQKNKRPVDLHLISLAGDVCIIIPPEATEKYPNGFDLEILMHHLEEHFYWVSYVEKYNKEPWKGYGHGEKGYYELYLKDKSKYLNIFTNYFKCGNSRPERRRKEKELRKIYKI